MGNCAAVMQRAREQFGGKTQGHLEGVRSVVVLGEGEFLELMQQESCGRAVGF